MCTSRKCMRWNAFCLLSNTTLHDSIKMMQFSYWKSSFQHVSWTQINLKMLISLRCNLFTLGGFPTITITQNCKTTKVGSEYAGTVSMTLTGRTCQTWSAQTPHSHSYTDPADFPDATLADASNYCRNLDNAAAGPWCYTTNPNNRFDYCDVGYCGSEYKKYCCCQFMYAYLV